MTRLRLLRLEDRAVPAVATWDGDGADANWTTAANWAGDVAPQPGDWLVFPAGAARLTNTNDFAAGTPFGFIDLNGLNYVLGGNAIVLTNGIRAALPEGQPADADPRLTLPLTLTGPAAFVATGQRGFAVDVPVDLGGNNLTVGARHGTLALNGVIRGTGGVQAAFALGTGVVRLAAANTYTGQTSVGSGVLQVSGSVAGLVFVSGGVLTGGGTTGPLFSNEGTIQPAVRYPDAIGDPPGVLTTAGLVVRDDAGGDSAFVVRVPSRVRVVGSVQLSGALAVVADAAAPPGTTFTLIDNDGTDPVAGQFRSLPEGAVVPAGGVPFRISYRGGDGNDVTLTAVAKPAYAVGAGAGGVPQVNVFDQNGELVRSFLAYDASFRGGVNVVVGDVTNDGTPDVVTAPGSGGGPVVRVWDGVTGALVSEFLAYDPAFRGGVNLAVDFVDSVFGADIITGPGQGGGPHVKVFAGTGPALIREFFAYDANFRGGVSVAAGLGQVITGAGVGGGPHVRVFDARTGQASGPGFFAYPAAFTGGVNVAYNPSRRFILTAPKAGGGPLVRAFSDDGVQRFEFFAYDAAFRGGVSLALAFLTDGPFPSIVTGPASGGGPLVRQWGETGTTLLREFNAFDPAFQGGVNVG